MLSFSFSLSLRHHDSLTRYRNQKGKHHVTTVQSILPKVR
nr:MAG TPA: hypothetical protein [Caudoviricetes sp.]